MDVNGGHGASTGPGPGPDDEAITAGRLQSRDLGRQLAGILDARAEVVNLPNLVTVHWETEGRGKQGQGGSQVRKTIVVNVMGSSDRPKVTLMDLRLWLHKSKVRSFVSSSRPPRWPSG